MVGDGQQHNNRLGFDTQYKDSYERWDDMSTHEIADDARQEDAIIENCKLIPALEKTAMQES